MDFRAVLKGMAFFVGFVLLGFLMVLVLMRWFIGGSSLLVPDLAGKDMIHAVETLNQMNLQLKIEGEEFHPDIPSNYVISQEPLPGTSVKKGRTIAVVVSKGAHEVLVPRVEGKSLREAEITLQQNGFRLGAVSRTAYAGIVKDKVILQSPAPETPMNRGGSVGLLVSEGAEEMLWSMPAITGRPIGEAEELVEKIGMKVGALQYKAGEENGTVLEQKPRAGSAVRSGSPVDMVISARQEKKAGKEKKDKAEKTDKKGGAK